MTSQFLKRVEWEKAFVTGKQQGWALRIYKEFMQINKLYSNKKFKRTRIIQKYNDVFYQIPSLYLFPK